MVSILIQCIERNIGKNEFNVPGIGGAFAICIRFYTINEFNNLVCEENDGYASFWFTDKQLATRKFSFDDVKLAIKAVRDAKVSFNPFKVYYVDILDTLYAKKKKKKTKDKL